MGIWTNELTVLTKQGLNLIAKTPAGASYTLVKAVAGSGEIDPDPEKLSALTDVCEPVLEGIAMPAEYLGEQRARITSVFNNALLTDGFCCRQVGVYALDPDDGPILFMIKQASLHDEIPSRAVMPLNITHRDVVFIGNAGGIAYEPPDSLLVYQAEFKLVREMAEEAYETAQEALLIAQGGGAALDIELPYDNIPKPKLYYRYIRRGLPWITLLPDGGEEAIPTPASLVLEDGVSVEGMARLDDGTLRRLQIIEAD